MTKQEPNEKKERENGGKKMYNRELYKNFLR